MIAPPGQHTMQIISHLILCNLPTFPATSLPGQCPYSSYDAPLYAQPLYDIMMQAIKHVNPDQVHMVTFDQPVFALAKEIQ